jgi:hypothetical protein
MWRPSFVVCHIREGHRLGVFENRVLREVFGPKRKGVKGEWRKLQNEQLRGLYSSQNIIWVMKSRGIKWPGHGDMRSTYRILVWTP